MERIVYTLRFHGAATRAGVDGSVLMALATACGWTTCTRIDADGLTAIHRPEVGQEATLESEVAFTGESVFQESGTITFGSGGHRLRFSTVGSGFLGRATADGSRHGAVIRRVEGGEGQFANATGVMASVLILTGSGELMDHVVGLIFMHERNDP